MANPSIKGSAITGTVEDVKKLVQNGALSETELEQRLTGGALALIRQPIAASQWYDIRAVTSLVELLWELEGHGDPAYMRRRGEEIAERLLRAGLYAQLEFVKRKKSDHHNDLTARFEAFGRDLRLINTLSGSMLNFGRWISRPDPDFEGRYVVEIHDATALPVSTSLATEGFINRMMKEMGEAARWRLERPRPDLVLYRMDRPLSPAAPPASPSDANVVQSQGREQADASAASPDAPKHAIKGSVFSGIVEAVQRLRDARRIDAGEFERRLGADGLAYLDTKISLSSWYPIQVYSCMRELLRDIEGGGNDGYTANSAAESARRLIESGVYQQLNYLDRWRQYPRSGDEKQDAEERRRLFHQQLVLVSTLYNALYNFGTQKVTVDPEHPDRFQLEYWDEGAMPRSCRFAVLGFWNELGARWSTSRRSDLWRLEHSTDHYILRMTRDVADVAAGVSHEPAAPSPAPQAGAPKYGIKGSLFQGIVSEVKRLIAEGQIPTSELESLLTPEDRELISQVVLPGSWYPIATHDRVLKLLARKQAAGDAALYWIEGGRQAADQLASLGIYRQFEQRSNGLEDFGGRVLVTLSGAVYNFTSWKWCGSNADHTGFTIEVSDAAQFPETCRLRAQGFIERAASRAMKTAWCVTSCRVTPDRIVFEGERKSRAPKS